MAKIRLSRIESSAFKISSYAGLTVHAHYADNIWAAIKYHMESLNELMRTFKEFTNYSGLNVTYSKTFITCPQTGRLQF